MSKNREGFKEKKTETYQGIEPLSDYDSLHNLPSQGEYGSYNPGMFESLGDYPEGTTPVEGTAKFQKIKTAEGEFIRFFKKVN